MIARLWMVGLFVEDIKKMVEFYRDVLGFEMKEWNDEGPYAEFENEGVRFSMYVRSEHKNIFGKVPDYTKGINGTFELAMMADNPDDVDVQFKKLKGAGVTVVYEPRNEPWGLRSSMIADPEGNVIEIAAWLK